MSRVDTQLCRCYSSPSISTTLRSQTMTRVDEINAQIAKLEAERTSAMNAERANVLAKMKADIKLYGFKTSDFKGILLTRKKRATGTAAKKTVAKKTSK
jgi:hypothetical protein